MKKVIAVLLLVVTMVSMCILPAQAQTINNGAYPTYDNFTDISSCTRDEKNSISYCVQFGLMQGTDVNQFSPNKTLTRAEMATLLYRLAGSPTFYVRTNPFKDVSSSIWYYKAVMYAYQNNLMLGTSSTTFAPNSTLTREQASLVLYRFAKQQDQETATFMAAISNASYDAWTDVYNSLKWACGIGMITQKPGYNAKSVMYRKELAQYIAAYHKMYSNAMTNTERTNTVNNLGYVSSTRKAVINTALLSKGRIPYRFGGYCSYKGFDVRNNFRAFTTPVTSNSGITYYVQGLDITTWIDWVYKTAANKTLISENNTIFREEDIAASAKKVTWGTAQIGDIVFVHSRNSVQDVAIITGKTTNSINILHMTGGGVQIGSLPKTNSANYTFYNVLG